MPVADVAASFREAVADVLVSKAVAACVDLDVPRLLLGGGVIANVRVRELAEQRCAEHGIELRVPPLSLCTDNGAMIASPGAQLIRAGHAPSTLDFGSRLNAAGYRDTNEPGQRLTVRAVSLLTARLNYASAVSPQ